MSTAIRWILPWATGAILVASGTGCGSHFRYDGKWAGDRALDLPNVDRYTAHTVGHVELVIDGSKFTLTEAGIPTGGSVNYEGDRAILHTDRYMNRPLSAAGADAYRMHPPIAVIPKSPSELTLEDPAAVDGKPLVLKRAH